ncbi:MAG: carboxypeptidase-like regulatory domain-containing protein [Acidobacteriaceae bacterium]
MTAVIFFAVYAAISHGQATISGSISGTVTDPSGAVVAGAKVTVTNQATGISSSTVTSAAGFYTAQSLPGGDYTVAVSRQGFQSTVIRGIHIDPGQRRGQNIQLAVGNVSTSVTVEANAIAVQTESAESGGTISAKEVANMMLNGRNFQTLALIIPGVSSITGGGQTPNYGGAGYLGQTSLVIGGSSVEKSTYTIDGLYDMTTNALININVTPPLDTIQEFSVLKDNYSAKYGLAGAGQVLVETKSGTKVFHGTAYDYLRNQQFATARPFGQTAPNSPLHYNIFGYTLGGPLYIPHLYNNDRKRTFFFVGGEWRINHYAAVLHSRSMFYQAMRTGDFSASPSTPAAGLHLDAGSQALLASQGKSNCITNGPDGHPDQINPSCMDATSVALMNAYWPLPNAIVPGNLAAPNYINNGVEKDDQSDYIYRIDHTINSRNTITGRWMSEEVNDIRPSRNFNDPAPIPGAVAYTQGLNALLRWTFNITPNLINTLQGGETYSKVKLLPTGMYSMPAGASIAQAFPTADTALNRIPNVIIGGAIPWAWLGVGAQPNYSTDGDGVASDDVTWVKGSHVLQFGALYMFGIRRANANNFPMGLYIYTGAHTGDPAADYLLGLDGSYTQSSQQPGGVFHNRWGEAYFQDDWKATPRLTLNLGVHWSYYSPTTMSGSQVTNFDPSTFNAAQAPVINAAGHETLNSQNQPLTASGEVANVVNGLVFAGKNGTPYGFNVAKKSYFGPRIGFAYRLTEDGRTSIHGGYGLAYTQIGFEQTASLIANPPFTQSTTITNSLMSKPTIGAVGAPPIPSLTTIGPNYQATPIQTYSLTLEREVVPRGIVTAAYAGSTTHHLTFTNYDFNFPMPGTSSGTAGCAASASNPVNSSSPYGPYRGPAVGTSYQYDPCLNTGSVSSLYYRPYAGYSSMTGAFSGGDANYNSLQMAFIYRLSDLQFNAAYTWSKSLSDVMPSNPGANGTGIGYDEAASPQNPYNLRGDYGLPDFDRKHVFTSAWVYSMPFFRNSSHLLAREFLGGWGMSGLAVLESGFALNPQLGTAGAGLATRPNQIGPVKYTGKKLLFGAQFINPSAFQPPAYGYFGNASPGSIRGPKEVTFNVAADKNFAITERVGFKLRVEAFNVFNHPSPVVTAVWGGTSGGSFGQVIGAGDPRIMEFAGRFTF